MMKNILTLVCVIGVSLVPFSRRCLANEEIEYMAPPPPMDASLYPCNDCHDPERKANKVRHKLEDQHTDVELKHGPQNRWCYECHNPANPNQLHLADGTILEFKDSNKLCAQCHGAKFRIWNVGAHGKHIGQWNGKKTWYMCVNCHRPHHPKFTPIKPEPPPSRPRGDTGYLKRRKLSTLHPKANTNETH